MALDVQFVDEESGDEIQFVENVNHLLPEVGEEVVTHDPVRVYVVSSREGWSLANHGLLFVRIVLAPKIKAATEAE